MLLHLCKSTGQDTDSNIQRLLCSSHFPSGKGNGNFYSSPIPLNKQVAPCALESCLRCECAFARLNHGARVVGLLKSCVPIPFPSPDAPTLLIASVTSFAKLLAQKIKHHPGRPNWLWLLKDGFIRLPESETARPWLIREALWND